MNSLYQSRYLWSVPVVVWLASGCSPPSEPSLEAFQLHPEFTIELVAYEPLVFDPVDIEFDARGDAYVIEMPGYPIPEKETGRLVRLRDTDKDGKFDQRTIFSEDLAVATSVTPYQDGFLVASPPDLVYVKDEDGDGKEDYRQVILSGFSAGNTQHNFNGLQYGLDNWIYGANGGNSGEVYWPDVPDVKTLIRGQDFRINPEEKIFELYGRTSGGFELAFDDWDRIFCNNYILHITHQVFPGKYVKNLPPNLSRPLLNISNHNEGEELTRIYPIGEQVTRLNHPEQSGYFSGACGIMAYTGGAFPDQFAGNVFVADVVLNLIHRDIIKPSGSVLEASRGREKVEFLASSDRGFRPVNMTVGPDGAIYLLDMHRTIIEHPEWIPDEIENTLDLNDGKGQGRIYRITHKEAQPQVWNDLLTSDTKGLVDLLDHPNRWWRITAQRLLVERKDTDVGPLLRKQLAQSESPIVRLHSLYTLEGTNGLKNDDLALALGDVNPGIREHAIKMAENRLSRSNSLLIQISALAEDQDPRVRNQVALTLGVVNDGENQGIQKALVKVAKAGISDPWARMAVASGSRNSPLPILRELIGDFQEEPLLLYSLARMIGGKGDASAVDATLNLMANASPDDPVVGSLLDGLAEGWQDSGAGKVDDLNLAQGLDKLERNGSTSIIAGSWSLRKSMGLRASGRADEILNNAKLVATNSSQPLANRLAHLELVEFAELGDRKALLFDLLDTREPKAIQKAAIDQLGRAMDLGVAKEIIQRWPTLGPETRTAAGNILLYQPANHSILLTAIEQGDLKLGELNLHLERRRVLLWSEEESVRSRAELLFSDAGVATRKEAMTRMKPALNLAGDANAGQIVFANFCSQCHRVGENGVNVGPDLTEIFRKSKESMMHDILDPNAGCDTEYLSHTIQTIDGEIVNGIIAEENDNSLTLRNVGGDERVIKRVDIMKLTSDGLSLMPEGFEQILDVEQMADLLTYLQQYR